MKSQSFADEADGQLIRRFVQGRDEQAFAQLVERHGPLVAGVCARMLRNREDAEDSFQAVFLVLARRASALRRRDSVAGWLHHVAVRVCLNERRADQRRQRHLQEAAPLMQEEKSNHRLEELKSVIDEALAALPDRVREILILCNLEGRTQGEAARKLSIPVGTVCSRLTRGRELMRKRLTRQGLTIAVGGVAIDLPRCAEGAPAITPELVSATVRNAHIFTSGTEAAKSELGNKIISLAEGVLHAMLLNQWKTAACLVALLATTLFGGSVAPRMMPSFLNEASAATILYDNFNDGDFAVGSPANWFPVEDPGTFSAATGDLVMTPNSAGAVLGLIPEGIRPANGSFRTRVRFTDNSDGNVDDVGFAVRLSGADTYAAGIDTAGLMYIGYVTSNEPFTDLAALLTGFRIQEHDLYLQFDVFGDQLSLSAWRPNEPKPAVPQLQVTDDRFAEGDVGIFANPRTMDSATFRFVQITTDAGEPIPEPEAQTLLSIGAAMFAGCAIFGRRRHRSIRVRG